MTTEFVEAPIVTVAQLIDKLKAFDPDLPVVVRGYEMGVEDVGELKVERFIRYKNRELGSWAGPHEDTDWGAGKGAGLPHLHIQGFNYYRNVNR